MSIHEVANIGKIEFGIYSPEEIRNLAVCKIDNIKLTGTGSVNDDRLGCSMDMNEKCVTCDEKKDCPGHFGYIEFVEPVLHPMHYKTISMFLKCFCKQCHRFLLTEEQLELSGIHKIQRERKITKILEKIKKNDICSHCNSPQPKIIYKSKDSLIQMEYKQKRNTGKLSINMDVDDIKTIFDNVPDSDIELLGLNPKRIHPKNLVLTVLLVIPSCSRPGVVSEGNICDDDLTYQYTEILKANNNISKARTSNIKKEQEKLPIYIQKLNFSIKTLMNNSKGIAKRPTDTRPLKGIKERLSGKDGRIRSNLMGKRVDFSARTVIGSEPTLKTGQVAIPLEVAKIHTKPELVTSFNIEWLTELVNTNRANYVITTKKGEDGKETKIRLNLQYALHRKGTELLYDDTIVRGEGELKLKNEEYILDEKKYNHLKFIKARTGEEILRKGDRIIRNGKLMQVEMPIQKRMTLKIGDVVERQLIKGDMCLINRQPTLHRGSMLAVQVVPMPFKTFRFNLAVTKSFNADFDN